MNYKNRNFNKLKMLFQKNDYHVFFLINPIVEILILLWIKTFDIPESRIIIIKLRNNKPAIIQLQTYCFQREIIDRIFGRIGFDTYSKRIENFIKKKSVKYYLYSSWVHPEFNTLLNNVNCLGHFYLEEGQLSHRKRKFISDEKNHINAIKKQKQYAEDLETFHRKDALYFISIDPQAFPHIENEKKILFTDLSPIKQIYSPSLLGKKFIGIGPAPRRLKKTKLKDSLFLLVNKMPDNSIIKLHPGFQLSQKELDCLKKQIIEETCKKIEFCDHSIILELEMLFEKKFLFGAKSSLVRYAELFASSYKLISLYEK